MFSCVFLYFKVGFYVFLMALCVFVFLCLLVYTAVHLFSYHNEVHVVSLFTCCLMCDFVCVFCSVCVPLCFSVFCSVCVLLCFFVCLVLCVFFCVLFVLSVLCLSFCVFNVFVCSVFRVFFYVFFVFSLYVRVFG